MAKDNGLSMNTRLYSFKEQNYLSIERTDWNRIRKMVARIKQPFDWFSVLASIFGGAFLSFLGIIICDCINRKDINYIILSITICCLVIAILMGIVAFMFSNDTKANKKEILDEMDTVESKLDIPIKSEINN